MIPARNYLPAFPAAKLHQRSMLGVLAGLFSVFALVGCHVPPAPPHAAQQGPPSNRDDEGWLWRQLRGEDKPRNVPPAAQAQTVSQQQPQTQNPEQYPQQPPSAYPVVAAVGSYSPATKGQVIIPTMAIEQIEPATPTDIPMSKIGPAQAVTTPPPILPPDAPPSIVSSNSANASLEKKGFEWSDLEWQNIYKNMKKATGYGPNEPIARAAYKEGKELYAQQKYMEAAEKFKIAADRWPDTPLEEDALNALADSYFFADEYVKSHDTFEILFKKYSNSRHLETAVAREFAIGRFWEQMHDTKPLWTVQPNFFDKGRPWFDTYGYALKAYQNVRMYDPTGPLADHSVMAVGTSYFRHENFEDAAMEFDQLRKDYPNSEHQMLAHVLGLQAKMRVYQGDLYDKTAIKEAHEIADSALSQFGPKLGSEQARMIRSRSQIIEEEANRLFVMAQYYEKNAYYRGARIYYKMVIDEYPQTQKCKEAKDKLAAIQDKPDMPPDYLKPLTDLLPKSKKR